VKEKGRLENLSAVITGGSRGIGEAIATRFAEEGANVFICARNEATLEKTAVGLRRYGRNVIWHVADASRPDSVERMARRAREELERIDILVNNAGINITRPFMSYSLEEFDQVMKANVYSLFLVTQAILPFMMAQKQGKVINIASTAGKWGAKGQSAYNASKHAVVGLTRCLALELGEYNINVNAICPALVEDTDMGAGFFEAHAKGAGMSADELRRLVLSQRPLKRFIKSLEVADLAVYLASPESDSMTGQSISLCGGYLMI
jgi:NAD(P)-dependent dehydrogenase (short-subunit alcohol dehydrogenase family)